MGLEVGNGADLAGLAIIVCPTYVCYDAKDACLAVRRVDRLRRLIRTFLTSCAVATNCGSNEALRIILNDLCIIIRCLCCGIFDEGVLTCL